MLKFSCLSLNSRDFEWRAKRAVRKGASERGAGKGEFLHPLHSRLLSRAVLARLLATSPKRKACTQATFAIMHSLAFVKVNRLTPL